jgi:hypothetical protein
MTAGIKANVDGSAAIQVGGTDVIGLGTTGNINIPTSGARITGDFSNATYANRVYFQDKTTNNPTSIGVIPNGTNAISLIQLFNSSTPDNSSLADLRVQQTTDVRLSSDKVGTGTYLPLTFYTGSGERMRVDPSGNVGIGLTPTGTGFLEIKAGTTSAVPFELTAGTNASTAVAGGVEYDGRVFYATPQGTQRGVVPGSQFFRLDSGLAGANVNTAQNTFGVGVTLSSSTVYAFESLVIVSKSAGTTSHNYALNFGGGATLNNIFWQSIGGYILSATPSGSLTLGGGGMSNAASAVTVQGSIGSAAISIVTAIRGTVSINAGGTFIPQYTLSAAPGGAYTTVAGSYFLIYPIGASGANTSVGTWA